MARKKVVKDTELRVDDDPNIYEFRAAWEDVLREVVGQAGKPAAGIPISPETALYSTGILACVRVLSESIASIPLNLYRRLKGGGKEVADDHPLQEILAYQPNSWMTSFEWKEWMQSQMLLWGNAYSLIKPSAKKGAVGELIPLHASRMKVVRLENGKLRYDYLEPGNDKPVPYRQEQIIHLRWLSSDGVNGYVPVQLARDAVSLARAAEIYSSSFFANGAQGGTYIRATQPTKPEANRNFKQQWDAVHQGARQAFKSLLLPYPYEKVADVVNNASNQLIETRRYQLEEQARIYRVPLHMLGDLTNIRQSTVEQSAIDFVTFSLTPHCCRWKLAIRRDLITDDKEYFADFDLSSLMVGDYEAKSKYVREGWNMGALDIDEVRAFMGLNPLPGDEGKKRFAPANMMLLGAFAESPKDKHPDAAKIPGQNIQSDSETTPASLAPESTRDAAEALFRTTLRRLAAIESDGIIERRNKPTKLSAWFESHEERMKVELRDAALATGRDVDQFVLQWMEESRGKLLDCHRSGVPYEEAMSSWTKRESLSLD